MRGGALIIAGSVVAVALAGCKPSWFESREPWRAEAEAQCLKSGAVKEGAGVALLRPISGPGVCGADFPLKVAAVGEGAALGYTDSSCAPAGFGAGRAARLSAIVAVLSAVRAIRAGYTGAIAAASERAISARV